MRAMIQLLKAASAICYMIAFFIVIGTAGSSDCGLITLAELNRNIIIAGTFAIAGFLL